jgi:hypothetical protein
MSIDRRKLFAVGGFGALAGVGGVRGPEVHLHGGITIHIVKGDDGWLVAVPDFDHYRFNGEIPAIKMMPMAEFLEALGKELKT